MMKIESSKRPGEYRGKGPIHGVSLALALVLLLGQGACGNTAPKEPEAPAPPSGPSIEIHQPTAQLMPNMGAIYLTIANTGDEEDRLVSIESPMATAAETHETLEEDGVMRMVPRPEGFAIPAGGTVVLEPSGKHIMLIDPATTPEGASTFPLTLHFEKSGRLDIEAQLTDITRMDG